MFIYFFRARDWIRGGQEFCGVGDGDKRQVFIRKIKTPLTAGRYQKESHVHINVALLILFCSSKA